MFYFAKTQLCMFYPDSKLIVFVLDSLLIS